MPEPGGALDVEDDVEVSAEQIATAMVIDINLAIGDLAEKGVPIGVLTSALRIVSGCLFVLADTPTGR